MEAKLYIEGRIVSQIPVDKEGIMLPGPFAMLSQLQRELEWWKELNGPYDSVRVQINSPGGETTQGFAMGDWLRTLGVPVTTIAIGQCSSIATAPFLAGSTRLVHANTEMLIHLPTGGYEGTGAAAAQAFANEMADCESKLIDMYVERAGVDPVEIAALMASETTLTSEQALSLGFATAIVQPVTALAILPPKSAVAPDSSSQPQPAAPAPSLMSKFNILLNKMKTAFAELEETPEVKTALSIDTAGDSPITLTIDTGDRSTYEVGDMVYTDAEMSAAAPDGEHVLSDGNTITTVAGAITVITEPTTDEADKGKVGDSDVATAIQALAEGITTLTNEVKSMKTASAATNQKLGTLQNRYATLARGVKTNASSPPPAGSGGDEQLDNDPMKVAAANRAERRKNRFK